MSKAIERILKIIEEEAGARPAKDYVSALHSVYMDIGLALGAVMARIREEERNHERVGDSEAKTN